MPSKKGRPEPRWLVILEDIRSQNRSILAAVEASRVACEARIDRFEGKVDSWFTRVEAAIHSTHIAIAALEKRMTEFERRGP